MRKKAPKVIEYNPAFEAHGYRNVRWVENVSDGLRRVGFADEVTRGEGYPRWIDHKGWFIRDDDCSGEVYRGVVYQLPARDGETQYVYGYDDPDNDDCALLCFDPVTDKCDAARQADRFAEIMAEHEREYDRAWSAGRRVEDLEEEIKAARKEALELAEERRRIRWPRGARACAVIREKILTLYHEIQKARKERDELKDNYGEQPGFKG